MKVEDIDVYHEGSVALISLKGILHIQQIFRHLPKIDVGIMIHLFMKVDLGAFLS